MPKRESSSHARLSHPGRQRPWAASDSASWLRNVRVGANEARQSWNTMPTSAPRKRRSSSAVMPARSAPRKRTRPAETLPPRPSSATAAFRSVLFPLPDSPAMPSDSPGITERLTSCSTRVPAYSTLTPSNSSKGACLPTQEGIQASPPAATGAGQPTSACPPAPTALPKPANNCPSYAMSRSTVIS